MKRPAIGGTIALFLGSLVVAFIVLFLILNVLSTHPGNERHASIMQYLTPGVSADLSFLTTAEEEHMQDVKILFNSALILLVLCVFYLYKQGVPKTKYAGYSLLALVAFAAGMALNGFTSFWVRFHLVFFPQGNWQFPVDSVLITLYPETYFLNAALIFAGLVLLAAAALIGNFKIPYIRE